MRRIVQWALLPAAVAALACKGEPRARAAMSDDLKRDLKLASATQNLRISPDEVAPKSQQELAVKPKKAPEGPRVIRSERPTVKASAAPVEAAEIKTDIPQVQVMAQAPAPSETPASDAPPLARPSSISATSGYPGAQPIPSSAGSGGAGGILGGIFGAVIRGGGIGDDDHCDPRPSRRPRAGSPVGGDVYGVPVLPGGMGGGRAPVYGRPRM